MGWSSFWHAVSHPIDTIKSAGSSVAHASESAFHSTVDFVKHTADKAVHFVKTLPPVEWVNHNAGKIVQAAQDVGHAIVTGAKDTFKFVKHTGEAVVDGVKEVWHGAENLGNSLLDMTKVIPYALAGGGVLIAMSMMNKRGQSFSQPPAKHRLLKKYVL